MVPPMRTGSGFSGPNVAELASQLLAGREVEDALRLVIPDEDGSGSAKEQESYDACGHGARRACCREHDGAPYRRGEPSVKAK